MMSSSFCWLLFCTNGWERLSGKRQADWKRQKMNRSFQAKWRETQSTGKKGTIIEEEKKKIKSEYNKNESQEIEEIGSENTDWQRNKEHNSCDNEEFIANEWLMEWERDECLQQLPCRTLDWCSNKLETNQVHLIAVHLIRSRIWNGVLMNGILVEFFVSFYFSFSLSLSLVPFVSLMSWMGYYSHHQNDFIFGSSNKSRAIFRFRVVFFFLLFYTAKLLHTRRTQSHVHKSVLLYGFLVLIIGSFRKIDPIKKLLLIGK